MKWVSVQAVEVVPKCAKVSPVLWVLSTLESLRICSQIMTGHPNCPGISQVLKFFTQANISLTLFSLNILLTSLKWPLNRAALSQKGRENQEERRKRDKRGRKGHRSRRYYDGQRGEWAAVGELFGCSEGKNCSVPADGGDRASDDHLFVFWWLTWNSPSVLHEWVSTCSKDTLTEEEVVTHTDTECIKRLHAEKANARPACGFFDL